MRDRAGKVELRAEVNSDGERPSMDVVGAHRLRPGEPELIMNPSQQLDGRLEAAELVFDFKLYGKERVTHASITLHRRQAVPAAVRFPLRRPTWVFEADDFYSHHRRFDFVSPMARQLGFRSNVLRHAVDLVPLGPDGSTHHGDSARNDLFSFGSPVLAAAAGTVVDARPDSRRLDLALLKTDRMAMFGNHVVVKLETGELALYAHLRQGSVRCKVGDRLRPRQQLGRSPHRVARRSPISTSSLQTSADADGEGRPVRFRGFRRIRGGRSTAVSAGRLDIGQIVESVPVGR